MLLKVPHYISKAYYNFHNFESKQKDINADDTKGHADGHLDVKSNQNCYFITFTEFQDLGNTNNTTSRVQSGAGKECLLLQLTAVSNHDLS